MAEVVGRRDGRRFHGVFGVLDRALRAGGDALFLSDPIQVRRRNGTGHLALWRRQQEALARIMPGTVAANDCGDARVELHLNRIELDSLCDGIPQYTEVLDISPKCPVDNVTEKIHLLNPVGEF